MRRKGKKCPQIFEGHSLGKRTGFILHYFKYITHSSSLNFQRKGLPQEVNNLSLADKFKHKIEGHLSEVAKSLQHQGGN